MTPKIVSGGQSGADRAALDWAIQRGIPHGGWCPKGRLAEDGAIPAHYQLKEMSSKDYLKRTEQNVMDSNGTVISTIKPELSGGSKRTAKFAVKHQKPLLHLHPAEREPGARLCGFVTRHGIKTLNVAGPRGSGEPTIGNFFMQLLAGALMKKFT